MAGTRREAGQRGARSPARPREAPERAPPPHGSYLRDGRGLEFERVSFFTDAVYAIALTLLVVSLDPPEIGDGGADPAALRAALWEARANIIGFFVGFVLLGRFWLAHHEFFAGLRSIDRRLISLNLAYLAFVAFMPYPVALISEYEENPLAFIIFAGSMAVVSGLEVAMFALAARRGHTRRPLSPAAVRYGLVASGAPVAVMLLSMPLARWDTTFALLFWLVLIPFGAWLSRRAPRDAPQAS